MTNDEITALLDELADLSEFWKKNRAKGRIPSRIRDGMLMICREAAGVTEKNTPMDEIRPLVADLRSYQELKRGEASDVVDHKLAINRLRELVRESSEK